MAGVIIHSDFRAQEVEIVTTSSFSSSTYHEVMEPEAIILVFLYFSLIFNFKLGFSFSSFTLIKRFFSTSSFSAIKVVSLHIWDCWYISQQS